MTSPRLTSSLSERVVQDLNVPVPAPVVAFAEALAAQRDTAAVLFYGSILRTGDLEGVLDFYVLTDGPHRRGLRGLVERRPWPEVGYSEGTYDGVPLRAKIATLPIATFLTAAQGHRLDTTIWTRFVQPSALVWVRNDEDRRMVQRAIAAAAASAGRYAAVLGQDGAVAADWWRALFSQTYRAEFRVERAGREKQIVGFDPARYAELLPLAWAEGGVAFTDEDGRLTPDLTPDDRRRLLGQWRWRRRLGRPLNIARLIKAAFTFEGAARYAAWKIERHTGMVVPLTPWREKHPVLASPGVLWRLWRRRVQRETD